MGYETLENNRSNRFSEMLSAYDKVSFENFRKIKFDRQYPAKFAFPTGIDSLFLLQSSEYPDVAELITQLQQWDKNASAESVGAGTFFLVYATVTRNPTLYNRYSMLTQAQSVAILRSVKAEMLQYFGRTNLQLGDIQKLVRGDKELPLPGLPDVLAPMYAVPYKNGMWKGTQGDAYVELVRFTKNGPIIESIRKESPHYTDQMEMYTRQQTKTMTLDKKEVYRTAARVYHPQ
jgi:acyl-homoserine-lactone acylase